MLYHLSSGSTRAKVRVIQEISTNDGVDPRETLLVAGGGAAGSNLVSVAQELGCQHVLFPRIAGALSACGGQYSDIVAELSLSKLAVTNAFV